MKGIFSVLLLVACVSCIANPCKIYIEFFDESHKVSNKDWHIIFNAEGSTLQILDIAENGFLTIDCKRYKEIGVIIYYRSTKVDFGNISIEKFKVEKWEIGVDKRPFNEDLSTTSFSKCKEIFYIKFIPTGGGDNTMLLIGSKCRRGLFKIGTKRR